jgi:hypothetical protein
MREGRFAAIPKFMGSFAVVGRSSREIRKIRSRGTEFIPHGGRGVRGGEHRPRFVKKGAVKAFNAAVLRRSVRGGKKMKYTFVGAPALDAIGGKFPVVGNEAFESMRGLVFKK